MSDSDTYTGSMPQTRTRRTKLPRSTLRLLAGAQGAGLVRRRKHNHVWYRRDEATDVCERCDATRPHEDIADAPRRGTEELAAQALTSGQHSEATRPILEKMAAARRNQS